MLQAKAPPQSSPRLKKTKTVSQKVGGSSSIEKVFAKAPSPVLRPRPLLEVTRQVLEGKGREESFSGIQSALVSFNGAQALVGEEGKGRGVWGGGWRWEKEDSVGVSTTVTESTQQAATQAGPKEPVETKLNLKVTPKPRAIVILKKGTPEKVAAQRVTPEKVKPKTVTPKNVKQKKPMKLKVSSDTKKKITNSQKAPASEHLPFQGSPAVFKPAPGEAVMLSNYKTDYVQVQNNLDF